MYFKKVVRRSRAVDTCLQWVVLKFGLTSVPLTNKRSLHCEKSQTDHLEKFDVCIEKIYQETKMDKKPVSCELKFLENKFRARKFLDKKFEGQKIQCRKFSDKHSLVTNNFKWQNFQ